MSALDFGEALKAAIIGGRIDALCELVTALGDRPGFALIAVANEASDVARLGQATELPLELVHSRARLERDRLLVVPPDHEAQFEGRELVVARAPGSRTRLDKLLRSAADEVGRNAIGVVLSGAGTDGTLGLKRLKEAGGITIVQAGDATDMTRTAIATGMVDLVVPTAAIPLRLAAMLRPPAAQPDAAQPEQLADTLRDILNFLRVRTGHDFSGYKRATLFRRVSRRMQVCQTDTLIGYHQHLREHPAEVANLLRDFLISVTLFFRDQEVFTALATTVLPALFENRRTDEQIRVWVSGCATGEEAYTLAMLLADEAARHRHAPAVQVFATDIDEEALAEARQARYPDSIVADVPPSMLERYFTRDGSHFRVTPELRDMVLFSAHNLLRDPPFSRLDLISCRNLLIYLNRDAQDRVLNMFHFGLRPEGHLLLGSSESADNSALFAIADGKARIYRRKHGSTGAVVDALVAARWQPSSMPVPTSPVERVLNAGELHLRLVERFAPPSVLVSDELDILHVSEHAGKFLQVAGGEPTRQILRLVIAPLRLELRSAIYSARQSPSRTDARLVRFVEGGVTRSVQLRVYVAPPGRDSDGTVVLFDELTRTDDPQLPPGTPTEMEPVVRELEEELARTRDQLRMTIEQYETSLEELKASNEELQAINEELRSASEELETSKEELQSVNEELTSLNHELKVKIDEVSDANSDLQNLMGSTDIGVMFLDRKLHVKRYTPRAMDVYNVIPTDVGRPLAHITHRLSTNELPQLAARVLLDLRAIELEAASSTGQRYLVRLLPYRSADDRIQGVVLTFVDVTEVREAMDARARSDAALAATQERLRTALHAAPLVLLSFDERARVAWAYVLGAEQDAARAFERFEPGAADRLRELVGRTLETRESNRIELGIEDAGELRTYDFRVEPTSSGATVVGFDMSPSKQAELVLREADRRKDEFLATLSHELRNPLTPLRVALDVWRETQDPTQRERSLQIMDRQVTQLNRLVDDLLDLSRVTQGRIELARESIEVSVAVEHALEATRSLFAERNQRVEVSLDPTAAHVDADPMRLQQILTHLLANAARHTPAAGRIDLATRVDAARACAVITVRDDGVGIKPELLSRVFDVFFQARERAGHVPGALGVGLNLVRRLVELHGGTIEARSGGTGRGSEFVVELPLA